MTFIPQSNRINVVYKNGVRDHISSALLKTLINSGQVVQFERSDGWVVVGEGAVRGIGGTFAGDERRKR